MNLVRSERFYLKAAGLRRCRKCQEIKALIAENFMKVNGKLTSPCLECEYARRRALYVPKARKPAKGRDMEKRYLSRKAAKIRTRGVEMEPITPAQWAALKEAYDFKCAYCGGEVPVLTMDHVQALANGGPHVLANIVPACMSCNQRKSAGPPPADFQLLAVG